MQWEDSGFVLALRPHGENAAHLTLLTREHGRHAGLVRAAAKGRGPLQVGNELACHWNARLSEHLGLWRVELRRAWAAPLLDDPDRLAALAAACALADAALPEREPHPALHDALGVLVAALADDDAHWAEIYVRWELGLLAELGFGLDLSECAATGRQDDLTHVSPRSGRAVCAGAAAPYRGKLLALPAFLAGGRGGPPANDPAADVRDGLALTGFFLAVRVFHPHHRDLPAARQRLGDRLSSRTTSSGIEPA